MTPVVETIPEGLSLGAMAERISKSKYNSFPVVDEEGKLTGILSYIDYHDALSNEYLNDLVVAKDLATQKLVTVSTDDNLDVALEKIMSKDFSIHS